MSAANDSFKNLRGISDCDREMIESAEKVVGSDSAQLGVINQFFWGRLAEEKLFPYPQVDSQDQRDCDRLLVQLDDYLRNEHPSAQIDEEQEIPPWVIDRLFKMGVMGVSVPEKYGGLGLSMTSYNRVQERIGRTCASTAVVVSAHQSIGCKAILLYGTEEQKKNWLPRLANDTLSAFCLSEPNVGSDAAGQETRCKLSADGSHYILNGEKKWATSGAISGVFTVIAKQTIPPRNGGNPTEGITALICTPDMEGVEIYERNRSKCGIRGTWQARIRFRNAKISRENLLHEEGQGLKVALSCLDYGRCTLSSGMLGSAKHCRDQAIKWSRTRYQFGRPLSDFELIQEKIANMSALTYAMDAMLYMTTGMLDRGDHPVMVETAACKLFCSEMGWRVINDALQIMGGEGYMTENGIERAFRDSRINLIVEGANEVMQGFIFAYGSKALAEQMIGVQNALLWDRNQSVRKNLQRILHNAAEPDILRKAMPLAAQMYAGYRGSIPDSANLHPTLRDEGRRFCKLIREHSHQFKLTAKRHREAIVKRQSVQARISQNAMWLHAMGCVLSKLDHQLRDGPPLETTSGSRDHTAGLHFLKLAELAIKENCRALRSNADTSMRTAAETALTHIDTQPNGDFIIPEKSPASASQKAAPGAEVRISSNSQHIQRPDFMSTESSETQIGAYLINRLHQLGVEHVFGIPGDYVLGFYEELLQSPIEIVNTSDEQGAGFAADAYARIRGLGCVCITYCVGGLKVANSTAGAFAEKSPVVVISGAPGVRERKRTRCCITR